MRNVSKGKKGISALRLKTICLLRIKYRMAEISERTTLLFIFSNYNSQLNYYYFFLTDKYYSAAQNSRIIYIKSKTVLYYNNIIYIIYTVSVHSRIRITSIKSNFHYYKYKSKTVLEVYNSINYKNIRYVDNNNIVVVT